MSSFTLADNQFGFNCKMCQPRVKSSCRPQVFLTEEDVSCERSPSSTVNSHTFSDSAKIMSCNQQAYAVGVMNAYVQD